MNQMLAVSRELGYGDDWKTALNHVKNSYVPAGKQPELIHWPSRPQISWRKMGKVGYHVSSAHVSSSYFF